LWPLVVFSLGVAFIACAPSLSDAFCRLGAYRGRKRPRTLLTVARAAGAFGGVVPVTVVVPVGLRSRRSWEGPPVGRVWFCVVIPPAISDYAEPIGCLLANPNLIGG
jgi:hypothetical protein